MFSLLQSVVQKTDSGGKELSKQETVHHGKPHRLV